MCHSDPVAPSASRHILVGRARRHNRAVAAQLARRRRGGVAAFQHEARRPPRWAAVGLQLDADLERLAGARAAAAARRQDVERAKAHVCTVPRRDDGGAGAVRPPAERNAGDGRGVGHERRRGHGGGASAAEVQQQVEEDVEDGGEVCASGKWRLHGCFFEIGESFPIRQPRGE